MKIQCTFLISFLFVFCTYMYSQKVKSNDYKLETKGLLWKISGNNLQQPSYLFGTNHSNEANVILDSIKVINQVFDSVDVFVCEMLYESKMNYLANSSRKSKGNNLHNDSTYKQLLNEIEYKQLDSVLNKSKLSYLLVHNANPTLIYQYLKMSMNMDGLKGSYLIAKSSNKLKLLDDSLVVKAKNRKLNLVGLESMEELSKSMDSLNSAMPIPTRKQEVVSLMNYINNHNLIESKIQDRKSEQLTDYLNQDILLLYQKECNPHFLGDFNRFTEKDLGDLTALYARLILENRNNNWIRKIPTIISRESAFIAVGAAHLAGKKGLINQLRLLGYTVERVD